MEFSYKGLTLNVPRDVYRPADDSFMLAEAAEDLRGTVLEVGCGSGTVSLACARNAKSVLGVDINPLAVQCARENAKRNNISNATFISSDLFSNVQGSFDAILFNPPYLPTSESEVLEGPLNAAFDGGKTGRASLDRFLVDFADYLNPKGELLLVHSSLNDVKQTMDKLQKSGMNVKIIMDKSFFFEKLIVLKATDAQY